MFALPTVPDGAADPGLGSTVLSGDVLFAGSIGRTDLPGGSGAAMTRSLRDVVLPLPDDTLVLPGHGPSTTVEPRARRQPLPARTVSVSQSRVTPISGFPEFLPADRIVEQHFLDVIRETFELHGFASVETRAVEPVERLASQGEDADKEIYAISRLAAGAERRRRGAGWGCTSTSPCPSPATCWRTPAGCRSRSAATRSRRYGAGSGRRRAATASSPRPTSTSSTSVRWPPHFEAEMPLVIADVFRSSRSATFGIQVNNRKIPEGFYLGIGLTDVVGTLRIVDKLDKVGPEKVAAMLVEAGASAEQAAACLALAAIRSADLSFVERVRALGVEHPTLDEGLDALAAVMRAAMEYAPGGLVADLRIARGLDYYTGTVYETQLVGHESCGSVCSGGRYDALASDGRTTYPGVGISIGVSRLLGLLVGRRACRPAAPRRAACWWPLPPRTPARRACGSPRRCAPRGIPVRGGPGRGEVRQADPVRRAARHPVRLVPRAPGRAATRSRTSAAGTRSTPTRPPGSRRRSTGDRTSSSGLPAGGRGDGGPRPSRPAQTAGA